MRRKSWVFPLCLLIAIILGVGALILFVELANDVYYECTYDSGEVKKYKPDESVEDKSRIIKISIPKGLAKIDENFFEEYTNLETIVYPGTIEEFKSQDLNFETRSEVIDVECSDGKCFDTDAFYECKYDYGATKRYRENATIQNKAQVVSVAISDGVTNVKNEKFGDFTTLEAITVPSSVTKMGKYAFKNCEKLKKVNISDLSSWLMIDFGEVGVHDNDDPYFMTSNPLSYARHLYLNGEEVKDLTIPSGTTEIKSLAFAFCDSLTSITIPKGVTKIGGAAFFECKKLTSIVIPSGVTKIEDATFCRCENLTSITIPSAVTEIGWNAFGSCSNLQSINIQEGVKKIGEGAFQNCTSLKSIKIPGSVTSLGGDSFAWCENLESIEVDAKNGTYKVQDNCLLTKDGKTLVAGRKNSIIPDGVKKIGKGAFQGAVGLTTIKIPGSVTRIGESAFAGCSLESIIIPESVYEIGKWAFSGSGHLFCKKESKPSAWAEDWASGMVFWYNSSAPKKIKVSDPNSGESEYHEWNGHYHSGWWHYVDGKPQAWEPEEYID